MKNESVKILEMINKPLTGLRFSCDAGDRHSCRMELLDMLAAVSGVNEILFDQIMLHGADFIEGEILKSK